MNTDSFNKDTSAYRTPVAKVMHVNFRSIICASPTDDRTDGSASSEGYTEKEFVW